MFGSSDPLDRSVESTVCDVLRGFAVKKLLSWTKRYGVNMYKAQAGESRSLDLSIDQSDIRFFPHTRVLKNLKARCQSQYMIAVDLNLQSRKSLMLYYVN